MVYYKTHISYDGDIYKYTADKIAFESSGCKSNLAYDVNKIIMKKTNEERFQFFVTSVSEKTVDIYVQAIYECLEKDELKNALTEIIGSIWKLEWMSELEEITVMEYSKEIENASYEKNFSVSYRLLERRYKWDYFTNNTFSMKEEVQEIAKKSTKEEIVVRAKELLANETLLAEIDRIYDEKNPTEFLGHPVHYRIKCGSNASDEIVKLLVDALYSRGRILSKRINKIVDIRDSCYEEPDLANVFRNALGGTIIIDMGGSDQDDMPFASTYQRVVEFFDKLVRENNNQVLFIFVENVERVGFSKQMIADVSEYLDLIDIQDGKGSKENAIRYFKHLRENSVYKDYEEPDYETLFENDTCYTITEIHRIYNKWAIEYLRKTVYKSYSKCNVIVAEKEEKNSAYDKLTELIGLEKVKNMAKQIIATSVVDKARKTVTKESFKASRHMIFTGNPGSCKTTVARILASTLKEEGVLETGEFVECGSADLTGKYVGWTDKKVRSIFRQARGGILFIDEAYSLSDSGGSYGTEAINTIVQEMENHRDDVIVIFAGYPDKMKEFLNKNEGLRSRIAFHIDFPDYNVEELELILKKMMKDKNYQATADAIAKARTYFEEAVHIPEFGNGRFVRNVFEQAMMKQSLRLYEKYHGNEIPKKELLELCADDFDMIQDLQLKKETRRIGFAF